MITVWSVYWGDKYSPDYVPRLKAMVAKHLPVEHEFVCLTSHEFAGIRTVKPITTWPGWWQKIALFGVTNGPSIYFDIDMLICGDLSPLVRYTNQKLAMPRDFNPVRDNFQSSVMVWDGDFREPFKRFDPSQLEDVPSKNTCGRYGPKRLWGDQEYLTENFKGTILPIPAGVSGIVSYKMEMRLRNCIPPTARAVAFHGKPDYHELPDDPFVKRVLDEISGDSRQREDGPSSNVRSGGVGRVPRRRGNGGVHDRDAST